MIDILKLSDRYSVRKMNDSDAEVILRLCKSNTLYYRYCNKELSKDLIIHDLHITPPGMDISDKYFVGFFDGEKLVAVMDIIDGYPETDMVYIGFFMVDSAYQGRQIGSGIIQDVCAYLKQIGKTAIRLAIDKGNPQSTHFWQKNGFTVIKEVEKDGGTLLVADKKL